jgi:hypothetical protein
MINGSAPESGISTVLEISFFRRLVLVSDFGIRISNFDLRVSPLKGIAIESAS